MDVWTRWLVWSYPFWDFIIKHKEQLFVREHWPEWAINLQKVQEVMPEPGDSCFAFQSWWTTDLLKICKYFKQYVKVSKNGTDVKDVWTEQKGMS